jgi:hypothetical protein
MATNGVTRKWGLPQVSRRNALLGVSAAALIAIDLSQFTIAAGVGALALAAFVAAYFLRRHPHFGLYGFLIAELSPISLTADLVTAVLYQAFSILLLTAVIAPFPHVSKLSVYVRPALVTILVALVSLAPGFALFYSKWLTALQAASLSGVILLVVSGTLLFVRRDNAFLRRALGA